MANPYYDHTTYPQTGSPGSSAAMRSELAAIETGFDLVDEAIADALTGAEGAVTTATTQAGIATAQAGTATTQAGIATTQAGIATSQAGIAATQAGDAAASAAAALATKTAIDSTYDEFDDRYLGRKASDPTVDNDGGPLQEGALYFNTTTKGFRGYNGTAWINLPATTAATVAFTPAGGLSATNVQDALNELDAEKVTTSALAGLLGSGDIGVTVQAYDADTAKLDADQAWTGAQRGTPTTDNDLSFNMNTANNFDCTPSGTGTLTFTNLTPGQSGFVLLRNTGGYAISLAATTKGDASLAALLSIAGTHLVSYYCDGTNVFVVTSGVMV